MSKTKRRNKFVTKALHICKQYVILYMYKKIGGLFPLGVIVLYGVSYEKI